MCVCSRESDVRTAKTQSEERCGMKLPRAESHSQEQPYWTNLTARLPDRLGANTTHAIVKPTKEKCPSVGRRTPRTRNKVRRERLSTMVRKDVEEREDFREWEQAQAQGGVSGCVSIATDVEAMGGTKKLLPTDNDDDCYYVSTAFATDSRLLG